MIRLNSCSDLICYFRLFSYVGVGLIDFESRITEAIFRDQCYYYYFVGQFQLMFLIEIRL